VGKLTKVLILESGTIINFSMNGLIYIIEELKKKFDGKFLITSQVKYETIDRPLKVPRFELEALRVENLLDNRVIEMPSSLGISEEEIKRETKALMEIANHTIKQDGQWIKIVSEAEISCLALSSILTKRGIDNIISIDERTTRILAEKPENLEEIISKKIHQNVKLITGADFSAFSKFKFIRSSELAYVAYKKGLLKIKGPKVLEAALYATKYKGSSISHEEINALKKL